MKAVQGFLLVVVGVAGGWFARGFADGDATERAEARRLAERPTGSAAAPRAAQPRHDPAGGGSALAAGLPVATPVPTLEDEVEGAAGEEDEEENLLAAMVKTSGAQWKAWAAMQTKQKVDGLFADLGLDEETQALLEKALVKEAERQTGRALAMMLGKEEMDTAAFAYFMGLPPDLPPDLEREFATFLDDAEIAAVRGRVREAHEKQRNDLADMQVDMMGIGDLSDDQRISMREVFGGQDVMTEQLTRLAEVARDRDTLKRLMRGEGLDEYMEKGFQRTRRRVRDILTPEQYEKYGAYEKMMVKRAEMGIRMLAGFTKTRTEKPRPSGR